ncbi:MAG TPA: hypothetical protein VFC34_10545 [Puia sp.]|nr:hypothetical protein [Puia sp.]
MPILIEFGIYPSQNVSGSLVSRMSADYKPAAANDPGRGVK